MPQVETWFPCSIYYENNLFTVAQNEEWKNHLLSIEPQYISGGEEWVGDTYTTLGKYDLRSDEKFNHLIDLITKHVNNFARLFGCQEEYTCRDAWFNINREGTYQEYHTHPGSVFSAVYYVSVPEGSGRLVFKDPKEPDMMPLKNILERNELSYAIAKYPPVAGTVIIFRSYMEHLVEPGSNTDPRISLALNFF